MKNTSHTILVVEDNKSVRQLLKKELEEGGYAVIEATDGVEAITQALKYIPDLITMDVEIPKLNGFEACQKLNSDIYSNHFKEKKGSANKIPVVFITANDTLAHRQKGFELGAADFVTKPFSKGEVLSVVNTILRQDKKLEGTSVRAIVKKADMALSSVNYYFGSKEKLYTDCLKYVIEEKIKLPDLFAELNGTAATSSDDLSKRLYIHIKSLFFAFLGPDVPFWPGQLLMRSRLEVHPKSSKVLVAVREPEKLKDFVLHHFQEKTEKEALLWVSHLVSQLDYYITSKETVLLTFGLHDYDIDFIDMISDYTARSMVKLLDLPEPAAIDLSP